MCCNQQSVNNFKMTFREKLLPSKQPVFLAVNTWCPNFQKLITINNSGSFPLITIVKRKHNDSMFLILRCF